MSDHRFSSAQVGTFHLLFVLEKEFWTPCFSYCPVSVWNSKKPECISSPRKTIPLNIFFPWNFEVLAVSISTSILKGSLCSISFKTLKNVWNYQWSKKKNYPDVMSNIFIYFIGNFLTIILETAPFLLTTCCQINCPQGIIKISLNFEH